MTVITGKKVNSLTPAVLVLSVINSFWEFTIPCQCSASRCGRQSLQDCAGGEPLKQHGLVKQAPEGFLISSAIHYGIGPQCQHIVCLLNIPS